jgi:hypothetical protein
MRSVTETSLDGFFHPPSMDFSSNPGESEIASLSQCKKAGRKSGKSRHTAEDVYTL